MSNEPRSLIECGMCGATWLGSEDDECYWCDKRANLRRQSERDRLLFPEWMDWGDRFAACSPIDQSVWAQTRGFVYDYQGKWKRELFNAIPDVVSGREARDALTRYQRWMTHTPKSAS